MCLQKPHYDPYEHFIYRMKMLNKWSKQIMEPLFEYSEHFSNEFYIEACDKLKYYNDISTTSLRESKKDKNYELHLRENSARHKIPFVEFCDEADYYINYIEKLMRDITLLKEFQEVKTKLRIYEDVYDYDFVTENYLKGFVIVWEKKEFHKKVGKKTFNWFSNPVEDSPEDRIYLWDIPNMGKYLVRNNKPLMKIETIGNQKGLNLKCPVYTSYNYNFVKDYLKKGWIELTPMNQDLFFDNDLNITDSGSITILGEKE